MSPPLRVLVLEDSAADAELMVRELRKSGLSIQWSWVSCEEQYLQALDPALDVILADYGLPGFNALAALEHLKRRNLGIPFIVVTGLLGDEAAVDCIKKGATDYLLKDRLKRLGPAVARAVEDRQMDLKRMRAEDASQESRRRMERIVETVMDAIVTIDQTQRIIVFNPAAERMFGVSAQEAIGGPIERFIPRQHRAGHATHIRRFEESGVINRRVGEPGGISGMRASGEEFPIEGSISQVDMGGFKISTIILRDITKRKANEAARDLLAREVDHRAKNALAVVQAVVALTRASTMEEFVEAVSERILALGRAHSLLAQNRWEGADLAQIVADETETCQRPGSFRIRGPLVLLAAHAVQSVCLLIHELATNAVKYGSLSVERGRVDIRWRFLPSQELELTWTESGGPPVRETISKGFGSTLIHEVETKQLGGSIDLRWPKGGLRLVTTLPSSMCGLRSAPLPAIAHKTKFELFAHPHGARVLVVEDEALISLALCAALTDLAWDVVGPVATVQEAIRLIVAGVPLDAAVLDVNLAGQLVYPVAERLRSHSVPFVFCTGYEQLAEHEGYRDCPILRKPVDMRLLTDELHRLRNAA